MSFIFGTVIAASFGVDLSECMLTIIRDLRMCKGMVNIKVYLKHSIAVFSLLLAANAGASMVGFGCITDNDSSGDSCVIAESQLSLDVVSLSNQVLFTFSNSGSSDSFIADIYFMYEGIDFLSFDSILNQSGVSFSEGARPGHLPAYQGLPSFSVDADNNGTGKSGIDPGESLGILFNLDDAVFGDVLNAMNTGELVIGLHVQGIGYGNHFSESLTTHHHLTHHHVPAIPVPAAIWLFGSGLLAMVGWMRLRS